MRRSSHKPIGVLYLDSREKGTLLSQSDEDRAGDARRGSGVAIENARLYREALERRASTKSFAWRRRSSRRCCRSRARVGTFYDASGTSIACRAIGGDFFEYIDLPDGSFGFALGDVSGKGPPAALLTAMLQGIFSTQSFAPVEPAAMMTRVNQALLARGIESRFATIFFAILSADGRSDVLQRRAESAAALQRIRRSQTRDRAE